MLCSLFPAPKSLPLGDFGPAPAECTTSQRAGFCQTNLCRCNPECRKRRGRPLWGLAAPSVCGRVQINGHDFPPADKSPQGRRKWATCLKCLHAARILLLRNQLAASPPPQPPHRLCYCIHTSPWHGCTHWNGPTRPRHRMMTYLPFLSVRCASGFLLAHAMLGFWKRLENIHWINTRYKIFSRIFKL